MKMNDWDMTDTASEEAAFAAAAAFAASAGADWHVADDRQEYRIFSDEPASRAAIRGGDHGVGPGGIVQSTVPSNLQRVSQISNRAAADSVRLNSRLSKAVCDLCEHQQEPAQATELAKQSATTLLKHHHEHMALCPEQRACRLRRSSFRDDLLLATAELLINDAREQCGPDVTKRSFKEMKALLAHTGTKPPGHIDARHLSWCTSMLRGARDAPYECVAREAAKAASASIGEQSGGHAGDKQAGKALMRAPGGPSGAASSVATPISSVSLCLQRDPSSELSHPAGDLIPSTFEALNAHAALAGNRLPFRVSTLAAEVVRAWATRGMPALQPRTILSAALYRCAFVVCSPKTTDAARLTAALTHVCSIDQKTLEKGVSHADLGWPLGSRVGPMEKGSRSLQPPPPTRRNGATATATSKLSASASASAASVAQAAAAGGTPIGTLASPQATVARASASKPACSVPLVVSATGTSASKPACSKPGCSKPGCGKPACSVPLVVKRVRSGSASTLQPGGKVRGSSAGSCWNSGQADHQTTHDCPMPDSNQGAAVSALAAAGTVSSDGSTGDGDDDDFPMPEAN